jgi:hypothetical protein
MPVILATLEAESRRLKVQSEPRQIVYEILSQEYPAGKRAGRLAQVVERMPSTARVRPRV